MVAIGMLCGWIIIIVVQIRGGDHLSLDSKINELALCDSVNPVSTLGTEQKIKARLLDDLYLCGFIVADASIDLNIYLFKIGVDRPVYINPPAELYGPGFFSEKLSLPPYDYAGEYRVDVYRAREILGSISFSVDER
ncbi:MAG TPA: hypothetical protein VLS48_06365 [Anaerolineales bacterium]|nr:hypothetical protein [Anaerolineales bacterium]